MANDSPAQSRLHEVVTYEVHGDPTFGINFGDHGTLVPGQRVRARREQVIHWVNPWNPHPLGGAPIATPPLVEIPDAEPDGEVDLDLDAAVPVPVPIPPPTRKVRIISKGFSTQVGGQDYAWPDEIDAYPANLAAADVHNGLVEYVDD